MPLVSARIGRSLSRVVMSVASAIITDSKGISPALLGQLFIYSAVLSKQYAKDKLNRDMINLTYRYKLEPTKVQSQTMSDWLETSRKVWNYALGERKDW